MTDELIATDAIMVAAVTQDRIAECLSKSQSFLVEAGAGAGKTTSLIDALRNVQAAPPKELRNGRRVACITFTNVAKNQILARIDSDRMFFVATIHEFFWSVIQPFQKEIRALLDPEKFEKAFQKAEMDHFSDQKVEYSRGYRRISESVISLHHDDVPVLAAALLSQPKFLTLLKSSYPIVLIDEYQDTNDSLAQAIVTHCIVPAKGPMFGFFGDDWQQIHPGSVGRIDPERVEVISKGTNFRSSAPVVRVLNAMRPDLPQALPSVKDEGETLVFHTDDWHEGRVPGPHTQNDLNKDLVDFALERVRRTLTENGWDLSPSKTKTLILTHKSIAARQGYAEIEDIFENNDEFAKLENPVLRFLVENVEVARAQFELGNTGRVLEALGVSRPNVRNQADKAQLHRALSEVVKAAASGTVGTVLALLRKEPLALPTDVRIRLDELANSKSDEERSTRLTELEMLLGVGYGEITALREYVTHHSPFETEHGVKGAQFDNVIVLLGGGWNQYNFPRFLSYAGDPNKVLKKHADGYRRARNLFYVCASRPTTNLAILFTQQLDAEAHRTLESWFGFPNVHALAVPPTL
jgi:DNA helicase-2/ATP-dependent DNA helicase PcrA